MHLGRVILCCEAFLGFSPTLLISWAKVWSSFLSRFSPTFLLFPPIFSRLCVCYFCSYIYLCLSAALILICMCVSIPEVNSPQSTNNINVNIEREHKYSHSFYSFCDVAVDPSFSQDRVCPFLYKIFLLWDCLLPTSLLLQIFRRLLIGESTSASQKKLSSR